jgi:hypothetical protein
MEKQAARQGPVSGYRRGDVVRVRSREAILASLDADGAVAGLPFMPEMLEFCGQEVPVFSRADKTCDTIEMTGTRRRMEATVHLTGVRCDGRAHGGCQAGCLIYWREEWLERPGTPGQPGGGTGPPPVVGAAASDTASPVADGSGCATEQTLISATLMSGDATDPAYRCQATEALRASAPLSSRDVRQYVVDVRTRNVLLRTVLVGLLIAVFNRYQWFSGRRLPRWLRIRSARTYPFFHGTGTGERTPMLDLQPGELVEVRSKEEIMATLGPDNRNRGMSFDSEMIPYCGTQARVERKVRRILDERTGKMVKLSDCVVLENVVCRGIYHRFCQRGITPYWREAWLRRVERVG